MPETLYIEKGPGKANYFITTSPVPLTGQNVGQARSLRKARRLARRLLRDGLPPRPRYEIIEAVTDA